MESIEDARSAFACPRCGSPEVQALLWVHLATRAIADDDYDTECFCLRCEAHLRMSELEGG